ncbi:hypothetical protein TNCV_191381 [Trichonephila clavipes]|nr:hypothetical protein TNCV_191381 [Trichonephila clavipes]
MNSITERRVIHQVKIDPKINAPKIAASTSNTLGRSVSAEMRFHWRMCVDVAVLVGKTGSDVIQSGRPIFDDFFQHLWPYIGNNTANVVFQMVKRLWLIRIDQ